MMYKLLHSFQHKDATKFNHSNQKWNEIIAVHDNKVVLFDFCRYHFDKHYSSPYGLEVNNGGDILFKITVSLNKYVKHYNGMYFLQEIVEEKFPEFSDFKEFISK